MEVSCCAALLHCSLSRTSSPDSCVPIYLLEVQGGYTKCSDTCLPVVFLLSYCKQNTAEDCLKHTTTGCVRLTRFRNVACESLVLNVCVCVFFFFTLIDK